MPDFGRGYARSSSYFIGDSPCWVCVGEGCNGFENVEQICDPLHCRLVQSTRRECGLIFRRTGISVSGARFARPQHKPHHCLRQLSGCAAMRGGRAVQRDFTSISGTPSDTRRAHSPQLVGPKSKIGRAGKEARVCSGIDPMAPVQPAAVQPTPATLETFPNRRGHESTFDCCHWHQHSRDCSPGGL